MFWGSGSGSILLNHPKAPSQAGEKSLIGALWLKRTALVPTHSRHEGPQKSHPKPSNSHPKLLK